MLKTKIQATDLSLYSSKNRFSQVQYRRCHQRSLDNLIDYAVMGWESNLDLHIIKSINQLHVACFLRD